MRLCPRPLMALIARVLFWPTLWWNQLLKSKKVTRPHRKAYRRPFCPLPCLDMTLLLPPTSPGQWDATGTTASTTAWCLSPEPRCVACLRRSEGEGCGAKSAIMRRLGAFPAMHSTPPAARHARAIRVFDLEAMRC